MGRPRSARDLFGRKTNGGFADESPDCIFSNQGPTGWKKIVRDNFICVVFKRGDSHVPTGPPAALN